LIFFGRKAVGGDKFGCYCRLSKLLTRRFKHAELPDQRMLR
jgi:hypothetical protein